MDHKLGNWTSSLEVQFVAAKVLVSQVRNEPETSAYALLHFRTSYQCESVRFDFGIENILDANYGLPLGGANLVNYRMAGIGRSFNTRVT